MASPYNARMRTAPLHRPFGQLTFIVLLACTSVGWAQTGTPPAKPANPASAAGAAPSASTQPPSSTNQLIERIHVQGGAASIDEVRVGGETRSITVQPKGGFPTYDVQPATGTRAWKVLGF
jgi:hypothetical protein